MSGERDAEGRHNDGSRIDLYLLRHADAGDPAAWSGDDAARPLSAKGRRQADRLGTHLAKIGFRVDLILSSPKVRAVETASIVADAAGGKPKTDERLGGGLSMTTIEEILAGHAGIQAALLVGHDPDFSDLLAELTGDEQLSLRKGALARIEAARPLAPGGAILRWLLPPEALKPA